MWTEIADRIVEVTEQDFVVERCQPVSGGCINQGYAVSGRDRTYFVKLNQVSQVGMFEAEAIGLKQMLATATIRVPQPICWGIAKESAYIALEWLELGHGTPQAWEEMGRKLAAMHQTTSSKGFGWEQNNSIGSTPQINNWTADWAEFYANYRLGYQFQQAERRGGQFLGQAKLIAAIPKILAEHQVQPSLVHGDLWGGNAAFTVLEEPVIFDPATYFGDREVDIAMTELFGGFPTAFYRGYNEVFPLALGYKQRKILYNLYHILNHFNLFGGGYKSQAERMISQILSFI
ncbi:MAG: fructosamine kinase family protein [Chroococcidiopsidaceae cyanobacterium CP_BM_ER_R8_30]|nr:fructosamine kinase family protein [Chroococcidiopsidaceae cyanobacterium CP_BM_ER_R8_30]